MSEDTLINVVARRFRHARSRAAATYDQVAVLPAEVEKRMLERLALVRLPDGPIVDLGCATGSGTRALATRFPDVSVFGVDPAFNMFRGTQPQLSLHKRLLSSFRKTATRYLVAETESVPFAARTFALAWSNLFVHWTRDPEKFFGEVLTALKPGGLFMFSCLGPDTLKELKRAFDTIEQVPSVHRFIDMHDLGDILVHAGFADPVMDMEYITLTFPDLTSLAHDLRAQGASYAGPRQSTKGLSRTLWQRLIQAYEPMRRDGKLPATFEIVYGHAWKPVQGPRKTAEGLDIVRIHRPNRLE